LETHVSAGSADRRSERRWPTAAEDPSAQALAAVAHLPVGDRLRRAVRDRVVCEHLPLARQLAGRFAGRGEPFDDLYQVATVGLLNAADRFDASVGVSFAGFAGSTIMGELRHHFRDRSWGVHVERRLQELHLRVRRANEELTAQLRRRPSQSEIAEHLGVAPDEVRQAVAVSLAYRAGSLNSPARADGSGHEEVGDLLAVADVELESVAERFAMLDVIKSLTRAEQRLLSLRFAGNLTQAEIAVELGVSQMQVSRLLTSVLGKLRTALLADG